MKKTILILMLMLTQWGGAESCRNQIPFETWLKRFKVDAAHQGISSRTIHDALDRVKYHALVIKKDRRQVQFAQTFYQFSHKLISTYRLKRGQSLMKKYRRLFRILEKRYGVPAEVIVAYWGLETSYGAVQGKFDTIRSLATLAYDCRRSEKFRPELLSALKILDRGDLKRLEMRGAWAGEIGQTQFLPSYYLKYAVDFDGDGRRNLIKSVPDVLASTANYLHHAGWHRGEPWIEEVILPARMPWRESGLDKSYSLDHWGKRGIKRRNGQPLRGQITASLFLPMGRNGAAFLLYPNFKNVYLKWNESLLYSTTAAYFATRLAGAKRVRPPRAKIKPLSIDQIKTLQRLLMKQGYDVGKVDGIVGEKTRIAVQALQRRYHLPADAYPTLELLRKLQR